MTVSALIGLCVVCVTAVVLGSLWLAWRLQRLELPDWEAHARKLEHRAIAIELRPGGMTVEHDAHRMQLYQLAAVARKAKQDSP